MHRLSMHWPNVEFKCSNGRKMAPTKNRSNMICFAHVDLCACVRMRGTIFYLRLEMASKPKWCAESGRFPMTNSHGNWDNRWSTTFGTQHLAHSHNSFSAHTTHAHPLIHNDCFDQIMYWTRLRWSHCRQPLVDKLFLQSMHRLSMHWLHMEFNCWMEGRWCQN